MHLENSVSGSYSVVNVQTLYSFCRLSKCHSLIASGYCGGVDEALKENQGQYKNVFIFDLGVNP